jgi:hypothetical protein
MVSERPWAKDFLLYIFETQLFQSFIEQVYLSRIYFSYSRYRSLVNATKSLYGITQSYKKTNVHDIHLFDEYIQEKKESTWMRATFSNKSAFLNDAKYVRFRLRFICESFHSKFLQCLLLVGYHKNFHPAATEIKVQGAFYFKFLNTMLMMFLSFLL